MTKSTPESSRPRTGASRRESLLIFIHVPKAAGTTFDRILFHQYSRRAILRIGEGGLNPAIHELQDWPEQRRQAVRLVTGHIGFGIHELFPGPAKYLTFVRDPVERIISHYRHVLRTKDHYLHDEVTSRRMSLLDYACSGMTWELVNGQTQLLAGPYERFPAPTRPYEEFVTPTQETLELAKRHIRETFVLAGVTERFDESLLLLQRMLGWRRVGYGRANVAPKASGGEVVDGATVDIIRRQNLLDVELYNFCLELLEERVADAGSSFQRDLARFRKKNAVSAAILSGPRHLRREVARSPARRWATHLRRRH
jgi:Sulfotransferase family